MHRRGWLGGQQKKEPVKMIMPQALTAEEVSGKVCETKRKDTRTSAWMRINSALPAGNCGKGLCVFPHSAHPLAGAAELAYRLSLSGSLPRGCLPLLVMACQCGLKVLLPGDKEHKCHSVPESSAQAGTLAWAFGATMLISHVSTKLFTAGSQIPCLS